MCGNCSSFSFPSSDFQLLSFPPPFKCVEWRRRKRGGKEKEGEFNFAAFGVASLNGPMGTFNSETGGGKRRPSYSRVFSSFNDLFLLAPERGEYWRLCFPPAISCVCKQWNGKAIIWRLFCSFSFVNALFPFSFWEAILWKKVEE